MNKVTLCENTLDPSTWTDHDNIADVPAFLVDHFGIWPDTARVYLDHVSNRTDITPYDQAGIERLAKAQGHFFVVVYPQGIETIFVIIAIAVAAVALALVFIFRPTAKKNVNEESPNNSLSDRKNEARPNQRIPDIFGEVWATFDLLAYPYRTFVNNVELEHNFMCVGRGSYEIDFKNIRDDITPLYQVDGTQVSVFGPGNNPNNGGTPIINIGGGTVVENSVGYGKTYGVIDVNMSNGGTGYGSAPAVSFTGGGGSGAAGYAVVVPGIVQVIRVVVTAPGAGYTSLPTVVFTGGGGSGAAAQAVLGNVTSGQDGSSGTVTGGAYEKIVNLQPFGGVNGQTLRAPNKGTWGVAGTANIRFVYPNKIQRNGGVDFTASAFSVGDEITIGGYKDDGNDDLAVDPLGAFGPLHMGGQYFISSITSSEIQLTSPALINANWTTLASYDGGAGDSTYRNIWMIANGIFSAGPFTIINNDITEFWCNFVALQGSFYIDKDGNQYAVNSTIQVTVQQCDAYGNALGSKKYYYATIIGSKADRQSKGTTLKIVLGLKYAAFGGIIVSAKRISETNMTKGFTVSDEVQWRDAYVVCPLDADIDFGDVTTVQSIVRPTPAALAVKERKQNALVTRKVLTYTGAPGPAFNISTVEVVHTSRGWMVFIELATAPTGWRVKGVGSAFGDRIGFSGLTTATWLNDLSMILQYQSGTTIGFLAPDGAPEPYAVAADTGTVQKLHENGLFGPTKNAADILIAMALDPFIGNRDNSEVDFTQIVATLGYGGTVEAYFGASTFTEFCYTFDDSKISFEESANDLAQAVFCVAFRRGSILQVSFEAPTTNSVLLFNHRNKIPKSETRTVTFGTPTDNDGINLDYVEPNAPNFPNLDTTVTLYFPTDQSAVNAKKITAVGVRNRAQALAIGYRLYNKLRFQNMITTFDATEEAALLVINDRILVADNTRSDTQDGEVIDQASLLLTLSQKVVFDGIHSYTIYLQHPDETVEAIAIVAGPDPNQVVLFSAPSLPCVIDSTKFARTTYQIVNDVPTRTNVFLLSEKNPKDNKTYEVKAINYDENYYLNDLDGGGTGVVPSYLFMPTTRGRDVDNGDSTSNPTYGEYGDVYDSSLWPLGGDSGYLLRWNSSTLTAYHAPGYLYFDYDPQGVYGAPGSDDPTVPARSEITLVEIVNWTYQTETVKGTPFLWGTEYSIDGGSTWATGPNCATASLGDPVGVIKEVTKNITAAIIAAAGSIAAFDFTLFAIRYEIGSSIPHTDTPPGSISAVVAIGLRIFFNGATDTGTLTDGAGGGSGSGTGGGTVGGTTTGYLLSPSDPLAQADSVTLNMEATLVAYIPGGPNVNLDARTWTIADPGGTPVTYYISVYDPLKIGDSAGTLTDFIGTSLAAVHDGDPGYITIGSITAVHVSIATGLLEDIGITIDGGGSVPATGSKGFRPVDFDCTILAWELIGDQSSGSAVITIKKCAPGSFPTTASIVASAKPTLSAAQRATSSTLTGWTTTISAGDILEFNLDSVATHQRLILKLKVQRT